jgi:hypothetical protein
MKKSSGKLQTKKQDQLCCECECANCEIGAHERCRSLKCQMPKWEDVKSKSPKRNR